MCRDAENINPNSDQAPNNNVNNVYLSKDKLKF